MRSIASIASRMATLVSLFLRDREEAAGDDRRSFRRLVDVFRTVCLVVFALVGVGWLVAATDESVLLEYWWMLLMLSGIVALLYRLTLVPFRTLPSADDASSRGSLTGIISWSAALSLGPTALWVSVIGILIHAFLDRPPSTSMRLRRRHALGLGLGLSELTSSLVGLSVFRWMGGAFPVTAMTFSAVAAATVATASRYALGQLVSLPLLLDWSKALRERTADRKHGLAVGVAVVLPLFIDLVAVVVALVYAEGGAAVYLLFIGGVLAITLLVSLLAGFVTRSRQHASYLERLERLGRYILQTPVDPASLGGILSRHIPGMFPSCHVEVRLFPDQVVYRHPDGCWSLPEVTWDWVRTTSAARYLLPDQSPPWDGDLSAAECPDGQVLVTAPIIKSEGAAPIGGVALTGDPGAGWGGIDAVSAVPAIQTLASQIGSALRGAERYRMEQELSLAGQIQSSFLPGELPVIPGWQLTATLKPAHQTAGDFYDVVPLPNGRFGIVVADVADKGMGAALYMALARTLLRTYALEYHDRPDLALKVTNRRVLMDTSVTMFVTVFYGVLDPRSGTLTYCNAGHSPPYLVRDGPAGDAERLTRTGMALGAISGASWEQRVVEMGAGDLLLIHSDGVTDAQNEEGVFFGDARLQEIIDAAGGGPANRLQNALLQATDDFSGEADQFDDITVVILVRDTDASPDHEPNH